MRAVMVVIDPPSLDDLAGGVQAAEQVLVGPILQPRSNNHIVQPTRGMEGQVFGSNPMRAGMSLRMILSASPSL